MATIVLDFYENDVGSDFGRFDDDSDELLFPGSPVTESIDSVDLPDYRTFLSSKRVHHEPTGFDVSIEQLQSDYPMMSGDFGWQLDIVRWLLHAGRAGLFADCGLGKTPMQLVFADMIHRVTGGNVLILCRPKTVAKQTLAAAEKFQIRSPIRISQDQGDTGPGISITNYERLHLFDPKYYKGVILDESSVLKNFMGKTKRTLLEIFRDTPYKLCCTATPAPNDYLELGNHAEFLNVMPSCEMIARWFSNDTMHAGKYNLKSHGRRDFWRWVASWAISMNRPSDLGYSDDGFALPPLHVHDHVVEVLNPVIPPGHLFPVGNPSATGMHGQKRESAADRAVVVAKLVYAPESLHDSWIVWCDTDYEADALLAVIPDAVEMRGSFTQKKNEAAIESFESGTARIMITKPKIAGFGLNWQHCHKMAFVGPTYSFEALYQQIRRSWRFGQVHAVDVHIIIADGEEGVALSNRKKEGQHIEMKSEMTGAMRESQLENLYGRKALKPTSPPILWRAGDDGGGGDEWTLWQGDCVDVARSLPADSIGLCIHSPPFSNLYIYSDSEADMGNSYNDDEFFAHYRYLIRELLRITIPGRLCVVHCKDLPLYKGRDGAAGLKDFPGRTIQAFESEGWTYHSRVTIWKDPVIERARTNNSGLLHKQLCKDSAASRQGMADFLIVFRKWTDDGNFPAPVHGPETDCRFTSYVGEEGPAQKDWESDPRNYSIQVWQRYASPVWFDINQTNVLNKGSAKTAAKDEDDEKHICLARGSLVLTKNGHKPIQDVLKGDLVLTHRGRWRTVIAKENTGINPVVKIRAQGVCDLTLTPTHKVWAKQSSGKSRPKSAAKKSQPEWIESQSLDGAYVNLKLPPTETPSNCSLLHWWIVGRWIADGHIDQRNVAHISVGKEKLSGFLKKVGSIAGNPQERTAFQVPLKDKDFRIRNILAQCGKLAHGKHLPPEAFTLPKEYAKELLDGYMSGDGHYSKSRNRWYASSVSKELLIGIGFLVQRVYGCAASLHQGRPAGKTVIEGRMVNTRQDWILSWGGVSHSFSFVDEDGAWKKVKSVVPAGECETWNLRVEEDESYTADGCIVKNCPLQLDVIERCLHLWSNPGDLVYSPFTGIGSEGYISVKMGRRFIGSEGYISVKMGRRFIGSELKESYCRQAVKNLRLAVQEASVGKLF